MQRVESLTQQLERCADPAVRAACPELVGSLLEMHGVGLAKMLDLLSAAGNPGRDLIDAFSRDPLIASLLLLHGLYPEDLTTRVERALDAVAPFLRLQQVDAELLDVSDGVVRLRLQPHGQGRPSAALEQAIREAVFEVAPDLTGLQIEGLEEPEAATRQFSLPLVSRP
jgi:hypothetical protein